MLKGAPVSPKILIVIPAYNEEGNIGGVLDRILAETDYRDILVVNDGSGDGTSRAARERGVRVLDLPYNLGIGAAVQTGYKYARRRGYDYVVRLDADGQHEVTQLAEVLAPVIAGTADMVIGSRVLSEFPYRPSLPRRLGMRMLSSFVSRLVGKRVTDSTSGFRAVNKDVISVFAAAYPDDYPEVESIILLHRLGFGIEEVGVRMMKRGEGASSITALRSVYYMIKVVFAVMIELLRKAEKPECDGEIELWR